MAHPYTPNYYQRIGNWAENSAKEIVPVALELARIQSVVDVGCGDGTWLNVFRQNGIEDFLGIDGDYVEQASLRIPAEKFLPFDLKQPLRLERTFDLVVSLEVAEHLPPECADTFVDSLTRLGPLVLFSAAVQNQGGKQHVNEQWQDYWAERFQQRGYVVIDGIRRRIWNNPNVRWWYAQNILLYARPEVLAANPTLETEARKTDASWLSFVHPQAFLEAVDVERISVRKSFGVTASVVKSWLSRRIKPSGKNRS